MPAPDPSLMTTVYLVFLRKGPNWTAEDTPELAQLQETHLAHLAKMRREGKFILVGPTLEGYKADLRGICIARADSVEQARQWAEADPAVKAGRFIIEIHPWMVEKELVK